MFVPQGDVTTTYSYNTAGELTSDGTSTYTLDADGNRTSMGYSVGAGNLMTSDGTYNYTYDNEGNTTKKATIGGGPTWKYTYNDRNEMTSAEEWATDPDLGGSPAVLVNATYLYDAWGNRLQKSDAVASTTTRYAYDGWDPALQGTVGNTRFNILADLDSNHSNMIDVRYLHGDAPAQVLAQINVTYTPVQQDAPG